MTDLKAVSDIRQHSRFLFENVSKGRLIGREIKQGFDRGALVWAGFESLHALPGIPQLLDRLASYVGIRIEEFGSRRFKKAIERGVTRAKGGSRQSFMNH